MYKPELPILDESQLKFLKVALALFKVNDKPAFEQLSNGQKIIFYKLVKQDKKRLQIITSTQYGKSLVVALACLYLSCIDEKVVAVVAPSQEKAKIIMRYYIEHLGDNKYLYQRLERNTKLDRLRQEESKERIILNNRGGIFVVSAQERNSLKTVESAMGYGAEIVIGDEYCLVNDNTEATIFRMIAGKGEQAFYCKIGNPFYSLEPYSHFKKSWENERYERIFIDDQVALAEKRYNQEFLEEAKSKPLYNILFSCEFPDEDEMDKEGFRPLCISTWLKTGSWQDHFEQQEDKVLKLGVDIGGGKDKSKFVLRRGNFASVVATLSTENIMENVNRVIELVAEYGILSENVMVDDTGIGRGVSDRLKELGYGISAVNFGENPWDKKLFANRRAEMYWDASQWIKAGGVMDEANTGWQEMCWTKYKLQSGEKKIILEDKERVRQKFGHSPDTADALALTFYKRSFIGFV